MNQNWLVTAFFFALLLVILYAALLIVKPFLEAIAWAGILALIFYPAYVWLLKLLKGRSTLAALLVTVLITLLIVLPSIRIGIFLAQEALDLTKVLRALANGGALEPWKDKPWVGELLRAWEAISIELMAFDIDPNKLIAQGAQFFAGFLASQVKDIAQNIFLFFINFLIALFTFFFLLRDGKDLFLRVRSILPMDPEHQAQLFENVVNTVYGVVHGNLIVAMIQGVLAGLAYWFLGLPFAILLGVATAFAALLPVGGSTLITLPASLYLLFQVSYLKGGLLLIWSLGVVGTIDNLLKPVLIASRVRLPVIFLFFSIIGGLRLLGVLGLILGPVLFALLAALLDLYIKEYAKS